jgi:polynucleotide 5'-kinase involved in rRNA processing
LKPPRANIAKAAFRPYSPLFSARLRKNAEEIIARIVLKHPMRCTRSIGRAGHSQIDAWPILMQEVAVSVTRMHANGEDGERITAVNGPPGTGKTTLLRSFIADRLVERARALARYDNPCSAFTL